MFLVSPWHLGGEGPESEPGLFSNPYCESGSRQLSKPAGCSDLRLAKQPSSYNRFFIVGWIRYYLLMKPKYIKALYETADVKKKKSSWDSVKQKKIANRHVIFCYEIYFWLFKLQKSDYENSSFWGLAWNPVDSVLLTPWGGRFNPWSGDLDPTCHAEVAKKKKKRKKENFSFLTQALGPQCFFYLEIFCKITLRKTLQGKQSPTV